MHRSSWTILVLLVLIPTCNLRAEWTSPLAYDPAYHFLAVPLDPWTYSTAAGPAGGWGITATSSNPASLAFGPGYSAAISWLEGGDDLKSVSAGVPVYRGLRLGIAASWLPGTPTYTWWDDYFYPYPHVHGIWRSQFVWQTTLAYRTSTNFAAGASVRHVRSASIVDWALARDVHDSHFTEATEWTVDLGVRLAGLLESSTIGSVSGSRAPADQQLWSPGISAGLSILSIRVASDNHGLDTVPQPAMPTRIEAGLSWLALARGRSALTLNATVIAWLNDQRTGRVFTRDVLLDLGRWGIGMAGDVLGALGGGVSYWSGYADDHSHISWFLSFGPPALRLMFSKGHEMRSHDGYDYGFRRTPPDYADRVYLRALIPVGYVPKPKPVAPEAYNWRTVP